METKCMAKFKIHMKKEGAEVIEAESYGVSDGVVSFFRDQGEFNGIVNPMFLVRAIPVENFDFMEQVIDEDARQEMDRDALIVEQIADAEIQRATWNSAIDVAAKECGYQSLAGGKKEVHEEYRRGCKDCLKAVSKLRDDK